MENENKLNVLIVDDNPADIRIAKYAIMDSGVNCDIEFALDGEEALNYINKEFEFEDSPTPHIVFLDLNLPKENGLTVLKRIKISEDLKDIEVIVISGSEANSDVALAKEFHADGYIHKTSTLDEYSSKIKACLDNYAKNRELA